MEEKPLVVADLNPPLRATLVVDEDGLRQVGEFLSQCGGHFGLDVETNVAESFVHRKLRTIQVGNREKQYVIDLLAFAGSSEALMQQGNRTAPVWASPLVKTLSPYLETRSYVKNGFNLQFEYETLRWNLGVKTTGFYDCLLAERNIYAGAVRFNAKGINFWGAGDIFARYTGLRISKELQTSFDLETPLTPEQIEYAALDVRIPYPVKAGQAKLIGPAGIGRAVEIDNSAIPPFGEMKLNGFYLNPEKWSAVELSIKEEHKLNIASLDNYFVSLVGSVDEPPVTDLDQIEKLWKDEKDKAKRAEYRQQFVSARKKLADWEKNKAKCQGRAAINYGSHPQLLAALRKAGFKESEIPDTNEETLKKHSDKPIIKAIQNYRKTEKKLSTYGESFLEYIDPVTGRIHSDIDLFGAETGRTTSSKPNLQNIPKDKLFRNSFTARAGYVLVAVDMAGAELRILAEESGEPAWVEAFAKGWDVHSVGAEIIFGVKWRECAEVGGRTIVDDDGATVVLPPCAYYNKNAKGRDHQKCKCPRHQELRDQIKAINFGIAYGMEAGKLANKLDISKKEAQKLLDTYRAAFKQVTAYLKRSGENAKLTLTSRTLAGRRRLFTRPTWDMAKEMARKRAIEDKKDPAYITSTDVNRAYASMHGSIERQGKNAPIQGLNADIAKLAVGDEYMFLELLDLGADLVNFVHDEFDIEVPEENAQKVVDLVGRSIKAAAAEFMKKVEMSFDYKIGPYWSK